MSLETLTHGSILKLFGRIRHWALYDQRQGYSTT